MFENEKKTTFFCIGYEAVEKACLSVPLARTHKCYAVNIYWYSNMASTHTTLKYPLIENFRKKKKTIPICKKKFSTSF